MESAIVDTLVPGLYTAIVRGKNDGTGVGLVEVYDLDEAADSELGNISTRGFVDIDENVMIGGFIVGDGTSTTVVVRAIGPSLGARRRYQSIAESDPRIATTPTERRSRLTTIGKRRNRPRSKRPALPRPTIANPPFKQMVTPGLYTAIVRGKDNASGVGLMEVYNLP